MSVVLRTPVDDERQCSHCGLWFHYQGIYNHEQSHNPLWCVCSSPTPTSVYGWVYCGRCHRGFQPTAEAT